MVSFIPKPTGGERSMYLQCIVNRIWAQIRKCKVAMFWDTAVKGSSALRAGLIRLVKDECANMEGSVYATVLWDMEKFYDHMSMIRLAKASKRVRFSS